MQKSSLSRSVIIFTLHILPIFLPLFFLISNEELFEFNKMLLTYAAGGIILSAWIAECVLEKKMIFKRSKMDLPITLFLFSQLVSTAFSIHIRTSLYGYYTRFHGGLFSTVTYLILFYSAVTFLRKKHFQSMLISIFLGALLATLYAFPEHFGHSPSCLILNGEFSATCWIQDVQSRVFGTFGQPNWLAAYLILLLPTLLMIPFTQLLPFEKSPQKKWLFTVSCYLFAFLMFSTLLFTKSRSGILGIGAGLAVTGVLSLLVLWKRKTIKENKSYIGLGVFVVLFTAALFGTPFTPSVASFFSPPPQTTPSEPAPVVDRLEEGGTDSGDIRRIVWKGAIAVWKRYPLFGSGVETFAYSYYKDRPLEHNNVSEWDFLYNKAHNELLNFLATTGIVGLFFYLFLQVAFASVLVKKILLQKDISIQLLSAGILGGLIALHISNFFGFSTVTVTVLMFLLPALVIAYEDNSETITPQHNISPVQWLGIGSAAIAGLFLLMQILIIWFADHAFAAAKQAYKANDYQTAFTKIKNAIELSPGEGLYYELYSKIASEYALALAQQNESESAIQFANSAIEASNASLKINPVHLNFYKTRNQILLTIAQFEPDLYQDAKNTLLAAQELSPTDPKFPYFLGLIQNALGEKSDAIASYKKAVEMKPNYDSVRFALGQIYEEENEYKNAEEQYRYILEKINPANEQVKARLEAIATFSAKSK